MEHGRLALDRAPWTGDPAERERHALTALAIARRLGDRNLEFSAQALLGHAYVVSGRVDEGMSLIDEAMAAVAGGEVGSIDSVGEIYCRLLGACERATDVTRAERWMAAARRFVAWGDFVPPTCRLHYGGILIAVGRWQEAEEELLGAARVFEDGYRGMRAAPLIRLAELGTYTEGVGRRTRRSSRQSSSNERSASMSSDQIESLQPIAVRSDEGEARWWMGSLALVLATAEDTGGQMTIIEVTEPREKRPCTCTTSRTRPSTCSRGA